MDVKLILAVILTPFVFIGRILKTRLGILAAIILAVVIVTSLQSANKPTAPVEPYNEKLPSVTQAPTIVQTTSRVYYVQKYTDDGKVLTMDAFYYYDQDRWTKSKTPLPIDRSVYGQVRIITRSN